MFNQKNIWKKVALSEDGEINSKKIRGCARIFLEGWHAFYYCTMLSIITTVKF